MTVPPRGIPQHGGGASLDLRRIRLDSKRERPRPGTRAATGARAPGARRPVEGKSAPQQLTETRLHHLWQKMMAGCYRVP